MSIFCACVAVYYVYVLPSVLEGQKKVLDPLEVELRMTMSYHMGAGAKLWFLCKNKCS